MAHAAMLRLLIAALFLLTALSATDDAAKETPGVSEIGFATGKVVTGVVIGRDQAKKQLIYQLPPSTEQIRVSLNEVIFIRSADGKYEFVFPEEPATAKSELPAATMESETLLILGVGLQYSDNSALTAFAGEYARALAVDYNSRLTPAGFVAQPGLEAGILSAHFSAEYRMLRGDYALGLGAGYAVIPKSSAVVSSAAYSGQETINVDGYAVPVTLIFYYRIWGNRDFGMNLGVGGGALLTSVLLTRNFGSSSDYEEARGLAPMLVLRPEFFVRLGLVTLIAALPIFWAEGRPVGGDITGMQSVSRVAAASLTGAGLHLAVGYSF